MAWAPFPRLPTNEQHLQDRFYVLRLSCLQMIHLARCCERLNKQTLTSTLDINIKKKPFTSSFLNYITYIHTAYKQPISITFIAK